MVSWYKCVLGIKVYDICCFGIDYEGITFIFFYMIVNMLLIFNFWSNVRNVFIVFFYSIEYNIRDRSFIGYCRFSGIL